MENETEETYREQIPTKTYIDFWISDFSMKHEELTELLGIQPTEAENKGDEFYNKSKKKSDHLAHSMWKLSSNLGAEKSVEEHLKYMLNLLVPKKEIIKSIFKDSEPLHLQILIYRDPDFRDYFEIQPYILKELSEMNILLFVNMYSHIIE